MTSEMQIIVNDLPLDNNDWRKMYGQITNVTVDGVTKITCGFKIKGRTPDELNDRWNSTKSDFTQINPHAVIYADASASRPTEDISWLDGLHQSVDTRVFWDQNSVNTGRVIDCTFSLNAVEVNTNPTTGGGSGGQVFQGQHGSIKLIKNYSTGNVETRIVEATFGPTFDKTKYGPFALNTAAPPSVINGTGAFVGKTAFVLVGVLPVFKNGQKITISGTTNYNGIFEVLAITGQIVQATKPFGSAESPATATGVIGEGTTGEENYTSAKSSLLVDYLTTASDGGPDPTSLQSLRAVSSRYVDLEGSVLLVTLSSGPMLIPIAEVPSSRLFEVTVTVVPPEQYDEMGGTRPIIYSGKGSIVIDKVIHASTNMSAIFASSLPAIREEVGRQSGLAPTSLKIVSQSLAISADGMFINFELTYTSVSVSALKYNVTTTEDETRLIFAHRDFDGYHLPQAAPGPNEKTVLKVVTRIGYGALNLDTALQSPRQSGFTFVKIKTNKIYQSKKATLSGDDLYEEAWSALFIRYRLRKGGGGAGGGNAFKDGYVTPTGPDV